MRVPASALLSAEGLDPATAATLTDAALTPYHSIAASADLLRPGATALVIGAGGLGGMAVQILRAVTAARVVVLDVREVAVAAIADQVDLALVGDDQGVVGKVLDATGGFGAEVVLDLVGTDDTLALAAAAVAPYGAIRAIGLTEDRFGFETGQPSTSLSWGVSITHPYSGTYADLAAVVDLARSGHLTPPVQRFPLKRALEVFDRLEAGELTGRGVLVPGAC